MGEIRASNANWETKKQRQPILHTKPLMHLPLHHCMRKEQTINQIFQFAPRGSKANHLFQKNGLSQMKTFPLRLEGMSLDQFDNNKAIVVKQQLQIQ